MSDLEEPRTPQLAVRDLDAEFGDCYDIAYSDAQFTARRIDGTGPPLAAATAEDLHAAISADFETAGDQLQRAVIDSYQARGIEVLHVAGFWQAIVREEAGQMIITREDRARLLGRLRELDIAGELPG